LVSSVAFLLSILETKQKAERIHFSLPIHILYIPIASHHFEHPLDIILLF